MQGCLVNFNNSKAVVKAYNQEDFPYFRIKKIKSFNSTNKKIYRTFNDV